MKDIETPKLASDCVVFLPGGLLLIRRGFPPWKGGYALPGGFMEVGETAEQACARELAEETGLRVDPATLRLVGVYSDPGRDPRGHCVSIAFTARLDQGLPRAGDDAAAVEVVPDWHRVEMAFDHARIVADAERLWLGSVE
ncbi:8-oxo-dGTP diphosphatase [Tistlia consotensis]|uniref:8-oxo-dGTP diphosphatase n=1 Tax=Tistlia consotensis USBA 355 TaxID=560819 RepID=A0A1Y6BEU8_9PROT|nr:NUDIX hydrolase [Tistlia consotensis]SMF07633.1 8-oxo-dGTP diphosphatase [Tistlia consotensis USBA 355]SNR35782.1 8-oxo-dGTP diphosphatase [Tistlia consotensis]